MMLVALTLLRRVLPNGIQLAPTVARCDDGSVFGVKQTIYLRLPGPVPGQGVA